MMAAEPGAQGKRTDLGFSKTQVSKLTLAEAGIDKNLADRARRAAAMPLREFEEMIRRGREEIYRSAERAATSKVARKEKHRRIAARAKANLKRRMRRGGCL
jgi:hypothetical protein